LGQRPLLVYPPAPVRGALFLFLLLAAPFCSVAAVPTRAQQRCVVLLDRAGAKVAGAGERALLACIARGARALVPSDETLAACAARRSHARVARIEAEAARRTRKTCAAGPPFGPSSVAAEADAFAAMLHPEAIFGATLISVHADAAGARCQAAIARGMARVARARASAFTRCTAAGLLAGAITGAADLAACLASDAQGRIARASRAGARLVRDRCRATSVATACPAECTQVPLDDLFACLVRRVDCDFCRAATAADALPGTCQRYTDGVADPYCGLRPVTTQSVARQWDEEILDAIRHDTPRPTVHARNLFHLSAIMWDAWRAYGGGGRAFLTDESHASTDPDGDRAIAISFAAYRMLSHRYALSVNAASTQAHLDARMAALGYDKNYTATAGDGAAAVGNRIAAAMIAFGATDGANEQANYADPTYMPVNDPLIVKQPGTVMNDPNRWQPLALDVIITQNGIQLPDKVQTDIGARWGGVTPFASSVDDPGPPPQLDTASCETDPFRQAAVRVIQLSSELTPDDGATLDISPGAYGNNPLGTNDGTGTPINPFSGQPYPSQVVKRGDFGRVLAEFWADGPNSETPPGHWNVLANYVSDHPTLGAKRVGGTGPVVSDLEWDVKLYFAVNGAVHDAAITAWGLKRMYDSVRPISMIRYMGEHGQCSDSSGASYDSAGLPIVPGLVEPITLQSSAPGERHEQLAGYVGEIAIRAWGGNPVDPTSQYTGVRWIRAKTWVPYQKSTFVTPAFPGYTSGHSTFSRAAAEVLAGFTGSTSFPGGLGEFVAAGGRFLTFEAGPTTDIRLQWATYYDAADQAGQSRLWGGIHIPADDFTGRITGSQIGIAAWAKAQQYFARAP
jgi:hypothetical protein